MKLKISVNKNPTKEGIKVQFVLPQTLEGDAKAATTQKLQSKLNEGLAQYNLTVSQDTDVPYSNVIGFLIPIADVKLLIKKAISGTSGQQNNLQESEFNDEDLDKAARIIKSKMPKGEADISANVPGYKYGVYSYEAWEEVADAMRAIGRNPLRKAAGGPNSDKEYKEMFDKIDKFIDLLRQKKLIYLEW